MLCQSWHPASVGWKDSGGLQTQDCCQHEIRLAVAVSSHKAKVCFSCACAALGVSGPFSRMKFTASSDSPHKEV